MLTLTPTNQDRTDAAAVAFEAYSDVKGLTDSAEQSAAETLTDLLSDLRHFAAATQLDFEAAVRMSEFHYEEESS